MDWLLIFIGCCIVFSAIVLIAVWLGHRGQKPKNILYKFTRKDKDK